MGTRAAQYTRALRRARSEAKPSVRAPERPGVSRTFGPGQGDRRRPVPSGCVPYVLERARARKNTCDSPEAVGPSAARAAPPPSRRRDPNAPKGAQRAAEPRASAPPSGPASAAPARFIRTRVPSDGLVAVAPPATTHAPTPGVRSAATSRSAEPRACPGGRRPAGSSRPQPQTTRARRSQRARAFMVLGRGGGTRTHNPFGHGF